MPEGPRALQPSEWEQLHALLASAFRAPGPRRPDLEGSWLFDERNRENLRVIVEDGKVVSHAGMIHHDASLFGCTVKVSCVGEVGTYESCRGRGYGSLVFQDCCAKAAADGVDFMQISGDRGLYTRVGCQFIRPDFNYALTPENVGGVRAAAEAFEVTRIGPDQAADLSAIARVEPVRFFRPLAEWRTALRRGTARWRAADFWELRRGDDLLAYIFVNPPSADRRRAPHPPRARVAEYAGDRGAIFSALPFLLDHYNAAELNLYVQPDDVAFRQRLASAGVAGKASEAECIVRIINFGQLMERCRPLIAERIGDDLTRELRFEMDEPPGSPNGGFTIRRGDDFARIPDVGTLASYLFGTPSGEPIIPEGSVQLAAALAPAFPFPTIWYGVSHV